MLIKPYTEQNKAAETRCKHCSQGVADFPRVAKFGETERGIGWRSLGESNPFFWRQRRQNALVAKHFKWPRLCYAVEQKEGESVEDACKRLDIPTEVISLMGNVLSL